MGSFWEQAYNRNHLHLAAWNIFYLSFLQNNDIQKFRKYDRDGEQSLPVLWFSTLIAQFNDFNCTCRLALPIGYWPWPRQGQHVLGKPEQGTQSQQVQLENKIATKLLLL